LGEHYAIGQSYFTLFVSRIPKIGVAYANSSISEWKRTGKSGVGKIADQKFIFIKYRCSGSLNIAESRLIVIDTPDIRIVETGVCHTCRTRSGRVVFATGVG